VTRRSGVFALLALGGLLALVGSAQPWWRAVAEGTSVSFSGTEASGGLSQALGVVALAGLLLALTLRAVGRRVLAVLLGLTGLGMALVGSLRLQPSPDAVRTRVRQVSLVDQFSLTTTVWPWLYVVAGVVVLAAALLLWVGAPRWPERPSRFARPGTEAVPVAADATAALDLEADPTRAWQALDRGLDPTAPADPDPAVRDPDVQNVARRDTMDAKQGRAGPDSSGTAAPADRRSEDE
jgi:uncharacterized membrane protein (TIGR02234 family)